MSSAYNTTKDAALKGGMGFDTGPVAAYLVATTYTFNASHSLLSDIPSGQRIATTTMSGVNVSNGAVTANPTTFNAVTGAAVNAVVIVVDGNLRLYINDFGAGAGNTTITPNGSNITVTWQSTGIVIVS